MGSASLQFLGFALAVVVVFNLGRSVWWRQMILLAASLGFLAFFTPTLTALLPLAAFLALGFASLRLMQNGQQRAGFAPLLIGVIAAFIWLKKYTFIPAPLFLRFPYLTLGLSYIFFRVLHLIIDAHDGDLPVKVSLISYLNYTLNFTTLISGPIQRYQDFAAMQLATMPLPLNIIVAGKACERIVVGFFKVNVLSLFLSMAQNQSLNALQVHSDLNNRVLDGIIIAASYPLYLYCNFSGYIDIVIGIARFLRIELPENFDRPFSSDNFINFWSRWHITLSGWLKTYVYNPLLMGLMRRYPSPAVMPFLGVIAFFVTFFLVGVWHGQTSVFMFFGVLQGLGVSVTKLYQILMAKNLGRKRYKTLSDNPLYNALARGLTFTWFTFTLLWFWSNWFQIGAIFHSLGAIGLILVWLAIFAGATVILTIWEGLRSWLLSLRVGSEQILLSRYARTVFDTALVVVSIAVVMLLNVPAPDIVYKAF